MVNLFFSKKSNLNTSSLILVLVFVLSSCSSAKFNNRIQKDNEDILSEESFMRFNSNRFNTVEGIKTDSISAALTACHQLKFKKGLELLESQMHENKKNPLYWNALGNCYSINKEYSKALFYYHLGLEAFESKIDKTKNNSEISHLAEAVILNNMALIQISFKNFDEAANLLKKAIKIFPTLNTPSLNLAQIYLEFNYNDKALEIFKVLHEKNNQDIDILYALSLIYLRKENYELSYQYINSIRTEYLNRSDIVGIYAFNLIRQSKYIEAKTILEKRLFAPEFNQRNDLLLEEVNQLIKKQKNNSQNIQEQKSIAATAKN